MLELSLAFMNLYGSEGTNLGTFLLVVIIIGVIAIGVASMSGKEAEKEKELLERYFEDLEKSCKAADIKYVEPSHRQVIKNKKTTYVFQNEVIVECGSKKIDPAVYWLDAKKNELNFVGVPNAIKVPLDNIEMYTNDGSVSYISKVKNTGKDISLSGAVVGGLVAGSAGMAVGATKDRYHIETEVEQVDDRVVYVYYRDQNDVTKMMKVSKSRTGDGFDFGDYLYRILPLKSDKYLMAHGGIVESSKSRVESKPQEVTLYDKLEELKRKLNEGLITEEEYAAERKAAFQS